jgi:mRNA-degrading endonuclease RelE of RelBE toxin-antitoxin system
MSDKRTLTFLEQFLKEVKRLRKRYRHVEKDVDEFTETLEQGETPGDRLQGTGDYIVYKARVSSRDMQRGKSGSYRVIYYLQTESHIYLLTIYAKTEQVDITTAEILELIEEALSALDEEESDED